MQTLERVPPNNLDAERSVLGASLIDRESLLYAAEALRPDDFYDPRHNLAFSVMADMASKDRSVDRITFMEELGRRDVLDRVGGISFVVMLLDSVTTAANIEHHCAIVKDKAVHRELIKAGSDIAGMGFDETQPTQDIVAEAERMVFEIAGQRSRSTFKDMSDVIYRKFRQIETSIEQGPAANGIPSGFQDFDKLTGGFQPGSLNIIAARPSMGKTAFALNIAQRAAIDSDVNVLLFSLEMSAEQLAGRLLSAEAQVNLREIEQTGKAGNDEWSAMTEAAAKLSKAPIFIDDSSDLSAMDLRSKCRRFFSKHRDERAMVIVDYLQFMVDTRKFESRVVMISEISRSLKSVAREFNVPVIALSQLSRDVEKRGNDKRPILSDLRDSGAIEQDADLVAFLYRSAYYQTDAASSDTTAELTIAKHRNGPTGKIDLIFNKEFSRFNSMSYYSGGV